MVKKRVFIDSISINKLKESYSKKLENEFGFEPTESQLIEIGLAELEAYQKNKTLNISFSKKGKKLIIK